METVELFTAALNLRAPWKVAGVDFKPAEDGKQELRIGTGFDGGAQFECPESDCNEISAAYDVSERTWRHLNFFQYKTYIHARLPRVKYKKHGAKTVAVPWGVREADSRCCLKAGALNLRNICL